MECHPVQILLSQSINCACNCGTHHGKALQRRRHFPFANDRLMSQENCNHLLPFLICNTEGTQLHHILLECILALYNMLSNHNHQ